LIGTLWNLLVCEAILFGLLCVWRRVRILRLQRLIWRGNARIGSESPSTTRNIFPPRHCHTLSAPPPSRATKALRCCRRGSCGGILPRGRQISEAARDRARAYNAADLGDMAWENEPPSSFREGTTSSSLGTGGGVSTKCSARRRLVVGRCTCPKTELNTVNFKLDFLQEQSTKPRDEVNCF
jgi:hypothetical protein